jgi:hypothetical protein
MNDFDWHDPTSHEDMSPVWDALFISHPPLIEHITGARRHDAIGLQHVVCAFHAKAVELHAPIGPLVLLHMIAQFPNGAFAHRVGTDLFAKDIAELWQKCIDKLRAEKLQAAKEAAELASYLSITDAEWNEDALLPRAWLAPPHLMRSHITLLHGPGSAGKSMLIIAWTLALALGKPFGRLKPRQRCRVLLANFEDDAEEQMRRLSAALRYFGATPAELKGWLYRVSLGSKGDVTMFELDDNAVHATACWHALEGACEQIRPDAVALDPFVAINAVPENDNQLMRRVMTMIRLGLAQRFGCAVLLIHHDAKSARDDEDADQSNARGAGDIVNAVRFEAAVKKMTAAQAEGWGIDPARRGVYFRAGSVASKRNYSAPEEGEWFERYEVPIASEAVVYCVPWEPPSSRLDDDQTVLIVAAVQRGTKRGPYSPQLTNTNRSLAPVLAAHGITKRLLQRRALKQLLHAGLISKAKWRQRGFGEKTLTGLRAANGQPGGVDWIAEELP